MTRKKNINEKFQYRQCSESCLKLTYSENKPANLQVLNQVSRESKD